MLRELLTLILAMSVVMLAPNAAFAQQTIVYVDAQSTNVAAPSITNPGSTWEVGGK